MGRETTKRGSIPAEEERKMGVVFCCTIFVVVLKYRGLDFSVYGQR